MPKIHNLRSYISGLMLATAATFSGAGVATPAFVPRSVLARGQWVKVAIEETGVYEISYDELRQMGFADPDAVSVFGRGGRMQPVSFVAGDGTGLYTDDLEPVSILHRDDKIYFYGEGVDNFTFQPDKLLYPVTQGYFANRGRNIYSRHGYYFLTDSRTTPLLMSTAKVHNDLRPNAITVSSGVGLAWHEADLQQNHSQSGQLFWGESFAVADNAEQRTLTFPVTLPGLCDDTGVMNCIYYTESSLKTLNPWMSYGMSGSDRQGYLEFDNSAVLDYSPQKGNLSEVGLTGESGEIVITGCPRTSGVANLDYWSVTYPKRFPTLCLADGSHIAQDKLTLPYFFKGDILRFEMDEPQGCVVLDISEPAHPVQIPVITSGARAEMYMPVTSPHPSIVVFDTSRSQLRISGYTDASAIVANQDLHAMQETGYDLVIITIPALMEQAEALADIHRTEDGMNVAVVSSIQVYNEFSGGVPDPMAYRAFVKMLHSASEGRLKNLLLLGPLYSDIRGLSVARDMTQGLIGYQSEYCSRAKGAPNVNEYYGMMADYLPSPFKNPEKETIHVGVGVLPCRSASEVDTYIRKLQRYYDYMRGDAVYSANRRVNIGCPGDGHLHDKQSVNFTYYQESLTPGLLSTDIVINAYGNGNARRKTLESFNTGAQILTYYGHGSTDRLTLKQGYFEYSDVSKMHNDILPLMCFMGCSLSNPDRGERGIGEALVLDTEHGLIASVLATRETFPQENQRLMEQFNKSLSRADGTILGGWLRHPRTLGETFAQAKNLSPYNNTLSFMLIGDPAITLPMVLRGMGVEEVNREILLGKDTDIRLDGFVTFQNGSCDKGFNGTVVARVLEPAVTEVSPHLVEAEPSTIEVTYADRQILQTSGEVREGRFSVSLPVTADIARHAGKNIILNVTAYDPTTKTVMASTREIPVLGTTDAYTPVADNQAPVIESLTYDPVSELLRVEASDDVALNLSQGGITPGLRLHLDGAYRPEGAQAPIKPIGVGALRVSRDIRLGSLAPGTHTAQVEVTDAADNFAVSQLTFEVGASTQKYNLVMDREALTDTACFCLTGDFPAEALFTVSDTTGRILYTTPMTGSEIRWDGRDNQGHRLPTGRYKAYIIETGPNPAKGHSNTITVPLL